MSSATTSSKPSVQAKTPAQAKTLYDKLWDAHVVSQRDDGSTLIYIDRCLVHEVSSPQAFETLRLQGRQLWRPQAAYAVADHQVPTTNRAAGIAGFGDPVAKIQVQTLDDNSDHFGLQQFKLHDQRHGIVHVVGPEQGITLPGMTITCGDSHTSTHGALAALAAGIGTTELAHVFATQCLIQQKCKNFRVQIDGELRFGVTAKDLALFIIGKLGTAGGTGCAIEYAGSTVRALSMEARFTLCNMTIEAGARTGLVAYDAITEAYVKQRPLAPRGEDWEKASAFWRDSLHSDQDAFFDQVLTIDAAEIAPQITWGTKPDQVIAVDAKIPSLDSAKNAVQRSDWQHAQKYMGVESGMRMSDLQLDQIFIGSCTNSRIEDLRSAAAVVKGKTIAATIKRALVVPGSGVVKAQAEQEGLHEFFIAAGFEWRDAGCSMCNAMNPDQLGAGERCASTSNRNFEGRQGYKGRTHLVSPAMAAAAAIAGHFVDVRDCM